MVVPTQLLGIRTQHAFGASPRRANQRQSRELSAANACVDLHADCPMSPTGQTDVLSRCKCRVRKTSAWGNEVKGPERPIRDTCCSSGGRVCQTCCRAGRCKRFGRPAPTLHSAKSGLLLDTTAFCGACASRITDEVPSWRLATVEERQPSSHTRPSHDADGAIHINTDIFQTQLWDAL